jgi:hypothetical protein
MYYLYNYIRLACSVIGEPSYIHYLVKHLEFYILNHCYEN